LYNTLPCNVGIIYCKDLPLIFGVDIWTFKPIHIYLLSINNMEPVVNVLVMGPYFYLNGTASKPFSWGFKEESI
jgi:hypothetical protein